MIVGLKLDRSIRADEGFSSWEGHYNGQKVFVKKAESPEARERLQNQRENVNIINKHGSKAIEHPLRAPQTLAYDEDYLVTEWIEGQSLANKVYTNAPVVAETLGYYLTLFDREPASNTEMRKTFTSPRLRELVEERISSSVLSKKLAEAALYRFGQLQSELTPKLQDGELKPEHLFADPKTASGYVLIDSETTSDKWPRFYDLGNLTGRYQVHDHKSFATQILESFMRQRGSVEREVLNPLAAVLIVRGFSIYWEMSYTAKQADKVLKAAEALLERCIQARNLQELMG